MFILDKEPSNTIVNSKDQSLSAMLDEELITIACTTYGAILKKMESVF